MSVNIAKIAYSSSFEYQEIYKTVKLTIGSGNTATITHNLGYYPYVRIAGELFSGEFSSVFRISSQYFFALDYSSQGLYGYDIAINNNSINIHNTCDVARDIYVRIYK